jgi:hypothetical protein
MRRWSFIVGAVLIVLGGLLLLQLAINTMGINFRIMWIFWPLLLIGLGVWIIQGFSWRGWSGTPVGREDASIPLEGASEASVRVQHGAGRLLVGSGTAPDTLVSGSFGGGLDFRSTRVDGKLSVDMRIKERDIGSYVSSWTRGHRGVRDWDFRLSQAVPLSLIFETGANDARLDLTDLNVREIRLHTGASSTTIDLPERTPFTLLDIDSGAASVKVRVPKGVSAMVRVNAALSGVRVDTNRFPKSGNVYKSADWDTAACKAEIVVETGVGSIEVN